MDPVTLSKAKRYAESLIGNSVGMELRQSGGNIEWRQLGGEWAVLIAVNDLLGPGVPPGGDTGQVLSKASGTSGDTEWATPFDGDYDSLSNKPVLGSAAAEDASAFASADHAHGLGDLTDVDLSGIATGETIVWDGDGFTPGAASGGDMLKADYDSVGNGVVNEARTVLWDGVANRPSEFPPSAHSHPASEITGLQGLLDDKANVVSGSGTRVPTFTGGAQDSGGVALDTSATAGTVALRGAGGVVSVGAPTGPTHAATKKYVDDTVGDAGGGDMLKSEYDSVGDGVVNEARAVAWAGVTDKPSTFTPSIHSHGMSDVTGLPDALNGKANATHSHSQSDITGLSDALNGKANATHSHSQSDITGLADALNGKADTSHQHSAGDITSGTLSVARGGTGVASLTSGSFLRGNGTGAVTTRTPAEVLGDIGAAAASHSHSASDISSGTLSVARGGTGNTSFTNGSFLRGSGSGAITTRTPAQVKSDIDAMDKHFVVNNQTGASYTLALADDGALVTRNNSSANTLTIPTNASVAFPVGTVINFVQIGAGVTTVVAASGVTVNGVSAGSAAVTKRYSVGSLVKTATNSWILSGPIEDVS